MIGADSERLVILVSYLRGGAGNFKLISIRRKIYRNVDLDKFYVHDLQGLQFVKVNWSQG